MSSLASGGVRDNYSNDITQIISGWAGRRYMFNRKPVLQIMVVEFEWHGHLHDREGLTKDGFELHYGKFMIPVWEHESLIEDKSLDI